MLLKRLFDILGSFLGLILLSPIIICVATLIYLKMSCPVLFRQFRTGRYGQPFVIYKFRTMVSAQTGNTVTIKNEPRITKLGSRLRRYKLDELPELWNVLKGDMSFVGPRPDVAEYTNRLVGDERNILLLRPGLTGPATLKYANEEEILFKEKDPYKFNDEVLWPDKIKINLEYYYNRSFLKDLKLIFRTLFIFTKH